MKHIIIALMIMLMATALVADSEYTYGLLVRCWFTTPSGSPTQITVGVDNPYDAQVSYQPSGPSVSYQAHYASNDNLPTIAFAEGVWYGQYQSTQVNINPNQWIPNGVLVIDLYLTWTPPNPDCRWCGGSGCDACLPSIQGD